MTITADSEGPRCIQGDTISARLGNPLEESQQDCLYLNVYTPEEAHNLPVFVYIHGGGYIVGDGNQDLSLLLDTHYREFIAISFNYRVRGHDDRHGYR